VDIDEITKKITLISCVEIPFQEQWMYENKEALNSLETRITQPLSGQTIKRESFS